MKIQLECTENERKDMAKLCDEQAKKYVALASNTPAGDEFAEEYEAFRKFYIYAAQQFRNAKN